MCFEDICVIDLDGNILYAAEGKKPTGEWPFHTRIMKKRPDIKAIAPAHPPILTGFAIANNGMMEKPFLPEPIIEVGPILDEVLELIDKGIIQVEELRRILEGQGSTDVILTGPKLNDEILALADEVSRIETIKKSIRI